ncbi:MAG: lysoplasmalogenase [Clostridium sp.]|nr:lysoplasmalogenase [Clostridium sp.]
MNIIPFFTMYFFVYKTITSTCDSDLVLFKTLSSLCFLVCALLSYTKCKINKKYSLIIIVGLFFGLMGDVFLAPPYTETRFTIGTSSFAIGHIFFATAFLTLTSIKFKDFILTGIISSCIIFFITHNSNFNLGSRFPIVFVYCIIISFMFSKSLGIFKFKNVNRSFCYLTTLGAFLFLISDIVLTFKLFTPNPSHYFGIINLTLYYSAQGLIALSLSNTDLSSSKTSYCTSNN